MKRYYSLLLLCCLSGLTYAQSALIPHPRQLSVQKGSFNMQACKEMLVLHEGFSKEASRLQLLLKEQGYALRVTKPKITGPALQILYTDSLPKEGYTLQIAKEGITMAASDEQGLFYATQTLLQLIASNGVVQYCRIKDWPAFSWRGYMVDVGRNYQSIATLKQQIDVIARYKYNIFHFHFTEDIAWRLASRQYPELTAPESMTRHKGKFYTEADLKELIAYCRDRYIMLIPEIDMPGHSAAFKRAMKTDMQTDSGTAIVKNILKEFCETYDVPYLHIGGDEVHITNKQFLPEMIAYIHALGKQTIGWEPGGNLGDKTLRQLWMYKTGTNMDRTYIDSRHLYINHFDPLESVVTLYFRMIGNQPKENAFMKGGTLCLWHDRNITYEMDLFRMNPVYPDILTFAERIWTGGGSAQWTTRIGIPGSATAAAFAAFEKRLLIHQQRYFSNLPFPYVKQSNITWQLYGPFQNGGDLNKEFDITKSKPAQEAIGGTIVLRHWWAPNIDGWIADPKENTTWYATTKIWSDADKTENFWIGFNNFSRSPATDSPPEGAWDNKKSEVWVNGKLVPPPVWKRGGQKGDGEIPLVDEGYEYRAPTPVKLQKGWNTIRVKAPVGSFTPTDWQNPVKWMFTMVKTPGN